MTACSSWRCFLAVGCSLRVGEILALTWDCVDVSPESIEKGIASVFVSKELKRCDKSSLEALEKRGHSDVILTFPEWKQTGSKTALVLKSPKTESSIRRVFLPKTVSDSLLAARDEQNQIKAFVGEGYQDFNLVLAHETGRPYEERQIADKLRKFIKENNLPSVVFHSLRHCSTSIKLEISNGNIKAVQGDTGHAQARMVTDVYAHTHDDVRRNLAKKFEEDFFERRKEETSVEALPTKDSKGTVSESNADAMDDPAKLAYQLLLENPQLAQLIIAASQIPTAKG